MLERYGGCEPGTIRQLWTDVGRPWNQLDGGAGSFLRFIRQELMPFIQSSYPVRPEEKAIAGSSFGGLFALYTLFHHPDTFNCYIIGSPSIGWDEGG